ncbi:hypothetical protein PMAYCL1PPCAC_16166, partial [Pristionchus mayeri]
SFVFAEETAIFNVRSSSHCSSVLSLNKSARRRPFDNIIRQCVSSNKSRQERKRKLAKELIKLAAEDLLSPERRKKKK